MSHPDVYAETAQRMRQERVARFSAFLQNMEGQSLEFALRVFSLQTGIALRTLGEYWDVICVGNKGPIYEKHGIIKVRKSFRRPTPPSQGPSTWASSPASRSSFPRSSTSAPAPIFRSSSPLTSASKRSSRFSGWCRPMTRAKRGEVFAQVHPSGAYGLPNPSPEGRVQKSSQSKAERAEYYKNWIGKLRQNAISLLGGVCKRCGTRGSENNPLEFHHVVKEPNSGRQTYYIIKEALAHPDRFMLLCRRHHLDTHVRMLRQYGTMDPSEAMDIKAAMSIKANLIRVNGWGPRGDSLKRHWPGMD
jgi:5-methylcytosine-specific restriction endonuclease McrA